MLSSRLPVCLPLVVAVILALGGCSEKRGQRDACGDGLLGPAEECDASDLGGESCASLGYPGGGRLGCGSDCTFDVGGCRGAAVCGDGIVEGAEVCDDGNRVDCDGCSADCTSRASCCLEVEAACDVGPGSGCCDDAWGQTLTCATRDATNLCQRACQSSADCYWSTYCDLSRGVCVPEIVGPGQAQESLWAPCQMPGGAAGFALPGQPAPGDVGLEGICVERGGLAAGEPCDPLRGLTTTDRAEAMCAGYCAPAGGGAACADFCAGDRAFDYAIYGVGDASANPYLICGSTEAGCYSDSHLDPDSGRRILGVAYCVAVSTKPTCSLVGPRGTLIADPGRTCRDLNLPDARCVPDTVSPDASALGTVIGVCRAGSPVSLTVWAPCDPVNPGDVCPAGTTCAGDVWAGRRGTRRCLPYCDANPPAGAVTRSCRQLDDGGPHIMHARAECLSVSDGPRGASALAQIHDPAPSRLGLCSLAQ